MQCWLECVSVVDASYFVKWDMFSVTIMGSPVIPQKVINSDGIYTSYSAIWNSLILFHQFVHFFHN